jgi:Zn-dependent protease
LPPLDGGRIAVSILPDFIARPLARLEPYGMLILIALIIVAPLAGLNYISPAISAATGFLIRLVLQVTGNG